jgi:hypothetical protein
MRARFAGSHGDIGGGWDKTGEHSLLSERLYQFLSPLGSVNISTS